MNKNIQQVMENHRRYFSTYVTKDVKFRIEMLKKLKAAIQKNEKKIAAALFADLGKSEFEAYETETGIILEELSVFIRKLKKWSRPEKVSTAITHFPSKSFISPEPFGTVLIMSPWNYPFQLLMAPLIGAIAAGNCAVLKPAHYSEKTSDIISDIISQTFPEEYISVFKGGREINQQLLAEKYDYIFFTGGAVLGKIVMKSAAENLTPLTLELGGKSPCIVDKSVNIKIAAKRIVWGKFLNTGQTCVAPDYLLVHKAVKTKLIEQMKLAITGYFGNDPHESPDYPRIITDKQCARLIGLLKDGDALCGGNYIEKEKYIAPTILDNVSPDSEIMSDEIFGPILPIIDWEKTEDMIKFINDRPKPLAFYLFTRSNKFRDEVLKKASFGGGCINDTIVHLANPNLPFGGVGFSGMGKYHGKASFDLFSNRRSILQKSTLIDLPIRYAPYKGKMKIIKMFLK
ncbi:MAG: aldehyde dehydrogenase [Spirochaetes bacterium]|nr:aldehyde dehydrogenase [Spirochaetota bacterium]